MRNGMHGNDWWWFSFCLAVFWALVIGAVVMFSRRSSGNRSAREVLDGRLARGEIDQPEYQGSRDLISR